MMRRTRYRRYHAHPPVLLYFAVTAFLVVGAVNSQNNLLFIALGIAVGAMVVSGIVSGAMMMGIDIERASLPDTRVGEPGVVRYVVRNRSRLFPAFALHIEELPARDKSDRNADKIHAFVGHIGPGGLAEAEAAAWPKSRGPIPLRAVRVWTVFPFGIIRKSITFVSPAEGIARPLVLPVRQVFINRVRDRSRRGGMSVARVGMGDEYYGLRQYAVGDSMRQIAWKPSARTGDLLVVQHAAETPRRIWIELRDDPSWNTLDREKAIVLAASLAEAMKKAGFAVGLITPESSLPPANGAWHARRIQATLAMLGFDDSARPGARDMPPIGDERLVIGGSATESIRVGVDEFDQVLDAASLRAIRTAGKKRRRATA